MSETAAERTPLTVAIDGPSGSGKSSVSREVARRLGAAYLDTGAMYRAVTISCMNAGVDMADPAQILRHLERTRISISTDPAAEQTVLADGVDVTEAIRTEEVSGQVSAVATIAEARAFLVKLQQGIIAEHPRIVAEGRDITTVVAPDADARILLTASEEARLLRRGLQLNQAQSSEKLAEIVTGRDAKDSALVNFTTAADGVTTVDSSDLDFEQTVQAVLAVVERSTS